MERDETTRGCLARIQACCTSAVQALVSGIENCSGHKDIRAAFLACMLGIILVLPRGHAATLEHAIPFVRTGSRGDPLHSRNLKSAAAFDLFYFITPCLSDTAAQSRPRIHPGVIACHPSTCGFLVAQMRRHQHQ